MSVPGDRGPDGADEPAARGSVDWERVFRDSPVGIVLLDDEGRPVRVNRTFAEMVGRAPDELREMSFHELTHPDDAERDRELFRKLVAGEIPHYRIEKRFVTASGEVLWAEIDAARAPADPDAGSRFVAFVLDVTERRRAEKELEEELRRQALHDSLTGLPNRSLLQDRLDQALARVERSPDSWLAVLFLDLDGFKAVNDRHGHDVGDRMLRKIAEQLATLVRDGDTVARFGGDEFVILLQDLDSPEEAEMVARRVCQGVGGVRPVEASPTGLTVSVGVALVGRDDPRALAPDDVRDDPVAPIRWADRAMYRAKEDEGSSYRVAGPGGGDGGG